LCASALGVSLLTAMPAAADTAPPPEEESPQGLIVAATTQFRHADAIEKGTPVLVDACAEAGVDTVASGDPWLLTDESLAQFDALVMFQTSGDPWDAEQKAALERYQQDGGGIVAIHNATDMRGDYEWWDNMIGALMPGHAATGDDPGQPGT